LIGTDPRRRRVLPEPDATEAPDYRNRIGDLVLLRQARTRLEAAEILNCIMRSGKGGPSNRRRRLDGTIPGIRRVRNLSLRFLLADDPGADETEKGRDAFERAFKKVARQTPKRPERD
jgi:hypothetical protein